jgi:hypothetical protein
MIAPKEIRMSVSAKAKDQLSVPRCTHCGFEMTPMQLGHGPGLDVLDQVYECRSCGVMKMPERSADAMSVRHGF